MDPYLPEVTLGAPGRRHCIEEPLCSTVEFVLLATPGPPGQAHQLLSSPVLS